MWLRCERCKRAFYSAGGLAFAVQESCDRCGGRLAEASSSGAAKPLSGRSEPRSAATPCDGTPPFRDNSANGE